VALLTPSQKAHAAVVHAPMGYGPYFLATIGYYAPPNIAYPILSISAINY